MGAQTGQELEVPAGGEVADQGRLLIGPPLEPPPQLPVDVLAVAEKDPEWAGYSSGRRMGILQTLAFKMLVGRRGDMYVAELSDPTVDRLTDAADELAPLPDGYTRVGLCQHRPDPMARFLGELQVSIVVEGGPVHRLGRVLVLSTLDSVLGPLYIGTFLPRVRVKWDSDPSSLEVFAYHDTKLRYAWKAMWAGPGWVALLHAAGVEIGNETG